MAVKWRDIGNDYDEDGVLLNSDWERGFPFGSEVDLEVDDTIYWDDRRGWRGKITRVYDDGFIDWVADSGETDNHIDPKMFSVKTR